jgi:hypothetical protein
MIIKTVSESDFIREFNALRPDDFSNDALSGIYNYINDVSEGTGEPTELDVLLDMCMHGFTEYESLEEVQGNYWDIESLEDLRDHTTVIELPCDGLVIEDF